MEIRERKIRKFGNSLSITLSKEFLDSIGAKEGDRILVDETRLAEVIQKADDSQDLDRKVDMIMKQSLLENKSVYRALVDK